MKRITNTRITKSRTFAPSRLRALVVSSLLLLTACGFQPLHSEAYREALAIDLSSVDVVASGASSSNTRANPVARRFSELLTAEIEDQVNPRGQQAPKLYKLNIQYTEYEAGLFVKPDGTASRGDLIYDSRYSLTRIRDGKQVAAGGIRRVSSYNTSETADYASYVSIEDARKRGIVELAQDYKLRLATLLPVLNDPDAKEVETPEPSMEPINPRLQPEGMYETYRPGY